MHRRHLWKTAMASSLLASLAFAGVATANPADEVDELVDDIEQYATETLPRFIFEDVPGLVGSTIDNPPDLQEFVDAFNYPQPHEAPGLLLELADEAPSWVEAAARVPSRLVVTIDHERDEDGQLYIREELILSYQGEPRRRVLWGETTTNCTGIVTSRACDQWEEADLSPSQASIAVQRKRTNNHASITVRASIQRTDHEAEEHQVTSPKVPCSGTAGIDACAALTDTLE